MNLPDSSKARKEEKAEVLEKLTGTEIYSVISNTVYSKTTAIRNEWKELSARMGNIRLLTQEEIETLQQQSAKLLKHEKALQQKNEEIQRKIRWIEQLEQINNLNRKPRPPFRMPKSTSRSTSPVSLVTADGKHRKQPSFLD